jgi:hypothetical protein
MFVNNKNMQVKDVYARTKGGKNPRAMLLLPPPLPTMNPNAFYTFFNSHQLILNAFSEHVSLDYNNPAKLTAIKIVLKFI